MLRCINYHMCLYMLIQLYARLLHFERRLQFVIYPLTVLWGHSVELVDSFKMVPEFNFT